LADEPFIGLNRLHTENGNGVIEHLAGDIGLPQVSHDNRGGRCISAGCQSVNWLLK